jgi:hypothetical protein
MATVDEEVLRSDEAVLRTVRVASFTATPSTINPFQRSTLSWDVNAPVTRPPIRVTLRSGSITFASGEQGSRDVSPIGTTGYSLVASKGRATRVLRTEHVFVNTNDCVTQTIGEPEIRAQIASVIDPILVQHPELSRRRADTVNIEPNGLRISIRMKAAIDKVADPDINVDAVVSLRAEAGQLRWRLDRYSFDADFPWWQDLVTSLMLPAWLAVALAEGNQASFVRTELSDGLDNFVRLATAAADSQNLGFLSVASRTDRFEVTLCRKPE